MDEKSTGSGGFLEKVFHLKELNTNVRTEIIAGVTTFFAMAYIMFVNPDILSAAMGLELKQAIFVATIIATAAATLIMAFVANVPYGVAPGMGLNAFFTYTVCMAMHFTWQQALALVLICGIINIIITFSGLRKAIIKAMPKVLQAAIAGGIGMFIAYIGFKNLGLFKFTADAPLLNAFSANGTVDGLLQSATLPTGEPSGAGGTVIGGSGTIPAMVGFVEPALLLGFFGLILMIILLVKKVKGAILIGIIATTIVGIILDLTGLLGATKLTHLAGVTISWGALGESIGSVSETFFKMDFPGLVIDENGLFAIGKVSLVIAAAVGFILTDIFDCIGTFIGTGKKSGIFDDKDWEKFESSRGMSSRLDRALTADLTGTTIGAFVGTSNTTVYVESSAGIAEGGKSGLTAFTIAILFVVCLIFSPVIGVVPSAATAPALIVVGAMMMAPFVEIDWKKLEIAIPAFMAAVTMPLAYSITAGIGFGFISYVIVKAITGKIKEVHVVAWVVVALFIANYVLQAVFIGKF